MSNKCLGNLSWSRLALNIKGLEHKTEWLQYSEIEQRLKELDIPPSEVATDGSARYTIPAIYDASTNAKISDSTKILKYLDEAYPETPQLGAIPGLPAGVLLAAFEQGFQNALRPVWALIAPTVIAHLDGESADKYRKTFETKVKFSVEAFLENAQLQAGLWAKGEEALGDVGAWFRNSSGHGPWVMGAKITLPDIILGSGIAWFVAAVGEDSEQWKRLAQWDEGRWAVLWGQIKPYSQVY
ncbi:hypothetical protein D9611_007418 [Ephemerocybe angulata]|uniref:GST N-terminal domain-containing protein n=1 Tax=Ephemerocybe angulata TaxID=980116 RepID=A0A8H5CHK5_9AGAR|nr:hypothetical protein D9611_007418 [Tulosesus angulatus]